MMLEYDTNTYKKDSRLGKPKNTIVHQIRDTNAELTPEFIAQEVAQMLDGPFKHLLRKTENAQKP